MFFLLYVFGEEGRLIFLPFIFQHGCHCQSQSVSVSTKFTGLAEKYFVAGAGEKKLLNPDQKCLLTFPPLHRDGQDSLSLCTNDQRQIHNGTMAVRSVAIHGKNDLETSEGFICCGNFNYGHPAVRDCLNSASLST